MLTNDDGALFPRYLMTLSGTLKVCNLEMVLFDANGPRAAVDTAAQDEALFSTIESTFSFRARITLPAGWCLLGFIHHTHENSWCHGISITTDTVFTVLPDGNSEFMFGVGTRLTLMLLPLEKLERKLAELTPCHAGVPPHLHPLFHLSDTRAAQRLKALYENVRERLIEDQPDTPMANRFNTELLLESHLAASLASTAEDMPTCSRSRRKHYLIVQRAEQFMRANMRNDIYLNEMCNAAGVSERTLRYAFEDMLGISPNRYLSMLRLCTACRSLASSDVSRRSVKSVALSCGLWDLSRFADSYRRMFGELPHDTLMRSPLGDSQPQI